MSSLLYPPLLTELSTATEQIFTLPSELWGVVIRNSHEADASTIQWVNGDEDGDSVLLEFVIAAGITEKYAIATPIYFDSALRVVVTGGTVRVFTYWRRF